MQNSLFGKHAYSENHYVVFKQNIYNIITFSVLKHKELREKL